MRVTLTHVAFLVSSMYQVSPSSSQLERAAHKVSDACKVSILDTKVNIAGGYRDALSADEGVRVKVFVERRQP